MQKRVWQMVVSLSVMVMLGGCGHNSPPKPIKLSEAQLDQYCAHIASVQDPQLRQALSVQCPLRGEFHKSPVVEW